MSNKHNVDKTYNISVDSLNEFMEAREIVQDDLDKNPTQAENIHINVTVRNKGKKS